MTTTITNNGLPNFTPVSGNSGNGSAPAATAQPDSGGPVPRADDEVRLTDSARALQAATHSGDSAAVIDSQRVAQLQKALADGSYQVNPGHIADRMLALDRQIGGTGKA
ncbi:MAG: flagellar biosynthesis anti-sigma factor FlgM [Xanthomonadaceae bacterium]|jgi:negative regulator of flagellin synthesis FlgM|nr:flagellar biosynthesis anti-sigma factor FlgM [Xanthomonadaceae bacterium]MDE3071982.1 flagellar biosynthesis anti-sigma factor FlgM [Pseudomonadota bacterium]